MLRGNPLVRREQDGSGRELRPSEGQAERRRMRRRVDDLSRIRRRDNI